MFKVFTLRLAHQESRLGKTQGDVHRAASVSAQPYRCEP